MMCYQIKLNPFTKKYEIWEYNDNIMKDIVCDFNNKDDAYKALTFCNNIITKYINRFSYEE